MRPYQWVIALCLKITTNVAFSKNRQIRPIFVLLKLTCLVTLFDRKFQVFKKSPKLTIFGIFNELLSTQNVNVARFARNVEWDFFGNFQILCASGVIVERKSNSKSCFLCLFSHTVHSKTHWSKITFLSGKQIKKSKNWNHFNANGTWGRDKV